MKSFYLWSKALIPEFLIFIGSFFLLFFKRKTLYWEVNEIKRPILLIHGYLHNSLVWIYHGNKLRKAGLGPIYTLNLNKPFASIEEHIFSVKEKIEKIREETNRSDVIIIGHSMGGLVGSHYATKIADENSVTDVITIASPLYGTIMARLGVGKSAKEMRRNSDFVRNLREDIINSSNIRFYHIATKTDQLVIPYQSSILNEKSNNYILNGIGHASLLYSKKVNRQITKWLLENDLTDKDISSSY